MTDKEFTAERKRILKACEKWDDVFKLWTWDKRYHFHRDGIPDTDDSRGVPSAACNSDYRYMRVDVEFNCSATTEMDDHELDEMIAHEYAHTLMDELNVKNKDAEEHVATWLSKVVVDAYASGRK